MLILLAAMCWAQEPPPDTSSPAEDAAAEEDAAQPKRKWGGIVIPLAGANSTDGLGFGAGGEVFRYPADPDSTATYDLKLTVSTYFAVSGRYQSHFFQMETRHRHDWLVQVGLAHWTNLIYAGVGGADVVRFDPGAEGGNTMLAPYGMVAWSVPVNDWSVYVQGLGRYGKIDPRPTTSPESMPNARWYNSLNDRTFSSCATPPGRRRISFGWPSKTLAARSRI